MNSDNHVQERQQLRELLNTYSDDARTLPTLKAEEALDWTRWLEPWRNWLRDLIGPIPAPNIDIDWALVIQVVFWLLVGLLVAGLVYVLIRRRRVLRRPRDRRLPTHLDNEAATLQHALDTALETAHWGLAARLRWRLFLSRLDMQPHVTPHEFFHGSPHDQRWDPSADLSVYDQYRVMFSSDSGSRQWFDHYHGALATLEDERKHG